MADGSVDLTVHIPALEEIKELIMATKEELQARIDGISAQLGTVADGLRADIDALKAAVAAGANPDFTSLDARVAQLQGLDAENPPAPTA